MSMPSHHRSLRGFQDFAFIRLNFMLVWGAQQQNPTRSAILISQSPHQHSVVIWTSLLDFHGFSTSFDMKTPWVIPKSAVAVGFC